MNTRVTPVAQVELLEPGQRYQVKYDGFARSDLVAEMLSAGEAWSNYVDWRGEPAAGSAARYSAAMAVRQDNLNCVIARPFLDVSQSIGLGHFTTSGGTWSGLKGLGLPNEVKLYQSDGTANQHTSATSRFELPTDPVFCVSLYRAEPAPDHDWVNHPPYTEIHFGIGQQPTWALVLPYAGPMYLMHHEETGWRHVAESEHSVHVPTLEGFAAGQRLFVWVAALRGRIVVSTDGFAEDVWVYEVPGYTLHVPKGHVSLHHNAGQWMFSFFGIKMPTAYIHSKGIEAGYDTRDSNGQTLLSIRHGAVIDDQLNELKKATAEDTTDTRSDLTATQRAWKATIEPYVHHQDNVGSDPETGEPVGFETCVSPQLYAVQIGQYAEVLDNGEPQSEEISGDVKSITGDHPDQLQATAYELELDNQLGQYAELEEHRRINVSLGWRLANGEVEVERTMSGYVVEPPITIMPGGKGWFEAAVMDPTLRLRDEKSDGRCPVFDGWPVKEVFEWVLDRCGLDRSEQVIEDTGTELSLGQPERPLWYPEPGRPWLDFLREVCRFDYNAGMYFDESGRFTKVCRYCRQPRTAEDVMRHDGSMNGACPSSVDWELYTRGSVAPDPTRAGEILRLSRPRRTLSASDFANFVAVCGIGPSGKPVSATACDTASLYDPTSDRYVGWRKMHVEALESYTSQDLVNRLCQERLAELSQRPEHISIVTPLMPEVRIGQVIAVYGGETAGAADQRYRVTAVKHKVRRARPSIASTTITARWLGSEAQQ
ncbi:MAG: hypothetical protein J7M38_12150 [Armatimonadetes bacterium]|nr:hypothetical protein [Armatimonadota bacterium]